MNNRPANISLVQTADTPAAVKSQPGWMRIGIQWGLVTMKNDDEPRTTTALWAVVILLIACGVLLYFLGESNGQHKGVEKGTKDAQLQQITNDLQQLKQSKSADERMKNNLQLANELTNTTKETK